MPPIATSLKSVKAPSVTFGPGWTRQGNAMVHSNGTKAYVGIQPHVSAADPSKVKIVPVAGLGKAQLLPGGALVGINEKTQRPYVISAADARGPNPAAHAKTLSYGVHRIDGFPVRAFQATTVNVVTADGRFTRYDSRGAVRLGRGNGPAGAAAGAAGGGAAAGATQATSTGATPVVGSPTQSNEELLKQLQGLLSTVMSLMHALPDPGQAGGKSHLVEGLPGGISPGLDGATQLPVGQLGIDDILQQLADPKVLADGAKTDALNHQLRTLLGLDGDAAKGGKPAVDVDQGLPPVPTVPSTSTSTSNSGGTTSTSTSTATSTSTSTAT
jgi:hypothetical protein